MKTKMKTKASGESYVFGVVCGKEHSGSHALIRTSSGFAECQGCLEYYTPAELARAKHWQTMQSRGVRKLEVE